MTKADIALRIHQQIGIPETQAAEVLDRILEFFKATLQSGEPLAIAGFGTFTVRNKSARQGRNPRTGEPCTIAARRAVSFHASPLWKADVNAAWQERQEPSQRIHRADGPLVEREIAHGAIER